MAPELIAAATFLMAVCFSASEFFLVLLSVGAHAFARLGDIKNGRFSFPETLKTGSPNRAHEINQNTLALTLTTKTTGNTDKVAAAIDSGATHHFLQDTFTGEHHQPVTSGLPVETANGSIILSNSTDVLPIASIPKEARHCHKFNPQDLTIPLLSVKKFCDADLSVIFHKNKVQVIEPFGPHPIHIPGKTLIQDSVDPTTQLYMVNLNQNNPISAPGGGATGSSIRNRLRNRPPTKRT